MASVPFLQCIILPVGQRKSRIRWYPLNFTRSVHLAYCISDADLSDLRIALPLLFGGKSIKMHQLINQSIQNDDLSIFVSFGFPNCVKTVTYIQTDFF